MVRRPNVGMAKHQETITLKGMICCENNTGTQTKSPGNAVVELRRRLEGIGHNFADTYAKPTREDLV